MTHADLSLMDPDDLKILMDWLFTALTSDEDDATSEQTRPLDDMITEGLLQCFYAADLSDARSLLPPLAQLLILGEDRFSGDTIHDISDTFERLLSLGTPPFAALKHLANSKVATYRLLAANHLSGSAEHERKLLRVLLRDSNNSVRAIANQALIRSGDSQWWQGAFSQDPSEHLQDDSTQQTVKDWIQLCTFASVAEILSSGPSLLAAMPDPVRCDALRIYLKNPYIFRAVAPILGPILFQCNHGPATLHSLFDGWRSDIVGFHDMDTAILSALKGASPSQIKALWSLCVPSIHQDLPDDYENFGSPTRLCAIVAGCIWPTDEPLDLLLDRLNKPTPKHTGDYISSALWDALTTHIPPATIPWHLIEDSITRETSSYWNASEKLDALLSNAPADTRERIAQHWLRHGDTNNLTWVLKNHLLSPSLPPDTLTANLWACLNDDRLCAALFYDSKLFSCHLDWLRARLLSGDLSLFESTTLIRFLGTNSTGPQRITIIRDLLRLMFEAANPGVLGHREERAARTPRYLPPTDDEWTAYRALRDAHTDRDKSFWDHVLTLLPADASRWTPSDFSLIQEAKTLWEQGSDIIDTIDLASILYAQNPPDIVDQFTHMIQHPTTPRDSNFIIKKLHNARTYAARSLGLDPPALPKEYLNDDDDDDE